ncbi:glycosyltransferase [Mesorhizobium sp. BR115XR7A]|uniref:glycosyltransferase family 2 protein n=1 Tax=Mesorhizobium sp. BR115XR7A TaxID=2876645 RepID=UPI001CCCCE61|nr:glycosyltransferase family 2 protein [Mesorhizobium sp. BR115XR7A]MBZ9909339.1 glycosyltransferase [Mesorhizobium sp. BR115XR7A]MBZ9932619.1 glycosyltransferase [Mesorhizobium sp. BR1-1-5]
MTPAATQHTTALSCAGAAGSSASIALPRVSIVTPSFNQGAFVERTVRSVLEQGYPCLEYIVMDGGSTDGTLERLEPYRNHFAHFESRPDGGQSAAVAAGLDHATGDLMAYLNSDDVLLPGTLSFVAQFFTENPDVACIYSHRCIIDANDRVIGHWILPSHSNYLMERWDFIPQETCFWRRALFEDAGNLDPSFAFAMDYDLFVRYMRRGRFKRVNRFLAAFRVHEDAKTTRQMATIGRQEIARVRSKYGLRTMPGGGKLLSLLVRLQSGIYNRLRRRIGGLPPGKGFFLDTVWRRDLDHVTNSDQTRRMSQ